MNDFTTRVNRLHLLLAPLMEADAIVRTIDTWMLRESAACGAVVLAEHETMRVSQVYPIGQRLDVAIPGYLGLGLLATCIQTCTNRHDAELLTSWERQLVGDLSGRALCAIVLVYDHNPLGCLLYSALSIEPSEASAIGQILASSLARVRIADERAYAQRVRSAREMTTAIADQANNSLQVITGSIALAHHYDLDRSRSSEYLTIAQSEIERFSESIRMLLDLFQSDQMTYRRVALVNLVERTLAPHIHACATRGILIDVRQQIADAIIVGNPTQLAWVLDHLMGQVGFMLGVGQQVRVEIGATVANELPEFAGALIEIVAPLVTPTAQQSAMSGIWLSVCEDVLVRHRGTFRVEQRANELHLWLTFPAVIR